MAINTILRKLLDISGLLVTGVEIGEDGLVVSVRPRWQRPRCGCCGRVGPGYDRQRLRRWRHLSLGRVKIWLAYAPRRVECRRCGVRTEAVPWAAHEGRFTLDFEEMIAYLAQITDKTAVTRVAGIAWQTVGTIVERAVGRKLDPARLDGLRCIGIDEFSFRRRHNYLTVVVDHDRRRVIWAAPGRSAEVLARFFSELGPERCKAIAEVTMDMAPGYMQAVKEALPQARISLDRFHVQQLASDALDEIRRSIVRQTEDPEDARAVKHSRFALLKNPWNLTPPEKDKLSKVQRTNRRLYRAYLLKETLADALDYRQPKRAREALDAWLSWASRSKLKPFVRVARTIRKHIDGVMAYVSTRLTNAIVEGINNKLRMIARRAFGFHSAHALMAMVFLCCGGVVLDPPIPEPT